VGVGIGVILGVGAGVAPRRGFGVAVANTSGLEVAGVVGRVEGEARGDSSALATLFRRACDPSSSTILYKPSPMGREL
jgi:hypothetical protein